MIHALDALGGKPGIVEAPTAGGGTAEIDVTDVDRLGVRVRRVAVTRDRAVDVAREAAALPERLRSLPERVTPVEVSPGLGSRLRTTPKEMRDREFFDVQVEPSRSVVTRSRVTGSGEREGIDWTMTREQLERLVRELDG